MADQPPEFGNLRRNEGAVEVHVLPENLNFADFITSKPVPQPRNHLAIFLSLVEVKSIDLQAFGLAFCGLRTLIRATNGGIDGSKAKQNVSGWTASSMMSW